MSDANRGPSDDATVSVARQSDRLCDRFEFLLMAGQAVTVGDFLAGQGIDPARADPDLVRELDRLAACYDPEQRPTVAAPTAPAPPPAEPLLRPGAVLADRYELVELIGEGGMGSVWRAQQTEPVKRPVALKLIKVGLNSERFVARFDAERQALARMDHPNIARVFDAGVAAIPDEQGQTVTVPFFVMELVKGVPIAQFCDERKLTVRQRLELFVPVCHAIQHAHQKGVIHRDIKPGNVLVALYDDKPVPKVIDFGLAKATAEPLTEHTLVSAFGAVVGTLVYMSPEQAGLNQADIDTRSDVYSLGVLLYELLTGEPPLDRTSVGRAALHEILRMVREVDAPKPSARASSADAAPAAGVNCGLEPKRLSRLLRGDLDWVLLKALEKDRGRRYDTPTAFAADVLRYLASEPVSVGPPSAVYRLRKFVRRNRAAVTAGLAVFVALVAGVTGTTLALLEARQARADEAARADGERKAKEMAEEATRREAGQRVKAEAAYAKTAEVLDLTVSEIAGDALATQHAIPEEQKRLLAEVLKLFQEFAAQPADGASGRYRAAAAAFGVCKIEFRLGRNESAVAACETARERFAALVAEFPDESCYERELAATHHNLGTVLTSLGRWEEADGHFRSAIRLLGQLAADHRGVPRYRRDLAASHNGYGKVLEAMGMGPQAEERMAEALALREQLAGAVPDSTEDRRALAAAQNNMGLLLSRRRERDGATVLFRNALANYERLSADSPAVPHYQEEWGTTQNNLGTLFQGSGRRAEAEECYRKALASQETLAARYPAVPGYKVSVGTSCCNLGRLSQDAGRPADAAEWFDKAIALLRPIHDAEPQDVKVKQVLANSYYSRAEVSETAGRPAEAVEDWRRVAELVPDHQRAWALFQLGRRLFSAGAVEEAEATLDRGLALREQAAQAAKPDTKKADWDLAIYLIDRGLIDYRAGRNEQAVAWMGRAAGAFAAYARRWPGTEASYQLRWSHQNRAVALGRLGRHAEASPDWESVLEHCPKEDAPAVRAKRATCWTNAGRVSEALIEVTELTKSAGWTGVQWYDFACVFAIAADRLPDRKRELSERAVESLRRAATAGYRDIAHLKRDADLAPLRDRDDFKELVAELERKFPPLELAPPPRPAK